MYVNRWLLLQTGYVWHTAVLKTFVHEIFQETLNVLYYFVLFNSTLRQWNNSETYGILLSKKMIITISAIKWRLGTLEQDGTLGTVYDC